MLIPIPIHLKNIISKDRLPVLLMLAVWAIFFIRTLSGQFFYFLDDLKIIYYPLEVAYAQFQHAGNLPLWSHLFGFGHPLLAWAQLGFFTPLHVLLRALYVPPLVLLQSSILAYFALGMTGMYLFLKSRRIGEWPAALGAIVFAFSGFSVGHLNHVNFYTGTMVLPWLLLAAARFIEKPTAQRAGLMSVAAATIAVSSQPQITLYCFIIATIISVSLFINHITSFKPSLRVARFIARRGNLAANKTTNQQDRHGARQATHLAMTTQSGPPWHYALKVITLTAISGTIAFSLASLSILPLNEFLPLTDRSDAMMEAELLDFSYVPWHGITLLLPYFYGDHSSYWGAKSFQELAAFTGIIPVLLAGVGLATWQTKRALRAASAALIAIGLIMALGAYSPVYAWLVQEKIITSLSIPGRFMLFVVVGIALLASLGLHDLLGANRPGKKRTAVAGSSALALVLLPFLLRLPFDARLTRQLLSTVASLNPSWLLLVAGLMLFILFVWRSPRTIARPAVLVAFTGLTLIVFGWNFNPLTPRRQALATTPFTPSLSQFTADEGYPPRIYSQPALITSLDIKRRRPTPPISPEFSVFQPISRPVENPPCFTLPMFSPPGGQGKIIIGIHEQLTSQPLASRVVNARDLINEEYTVCFPSLPDTTAQLFLSFTSDHDSGINLYYYPSPGQPSAYLIRVASPTAAQLAQSQKESQIVISEKKTSYYDPEVALLARHLNAAAASSGARWIGALSLRNYREFMDFFLANDSELGYDGDGLHLLDKNRDLLNMLGITHLIQILDDPALDRMEDSNYQLVSEYPLGSQTVRLYANPEAYPKAWLASGAIFLPAADEVRAAFYNRDFDIKNTIALGGDAPPAELPAPSGQPAASTAQITRYQPTEVEVAIETDQAAWLVLSDSTTPQWHTYLDGKPAPYYTANSMFKAAHVPPGKHTVTFKYDSPAVNLSVKLTLVGILGFISLILFDPIHAISHRLLKKT